MLTIGQQLIAEGKARLLTSSLPPLAGEFLLAQMPALHHSPLEGESVARGPKTGVACFGGGGPGRLDVQSGPNATTETVPPTCSPAGSALVSQTPPQGGSDNNHPSC